MSFHVHFWHSCRDDEEFLGSSPGAGEVIELLQILCRDCERWKKVSLHLPRTFFYRIQDAVRSKSLPRLESLELYHTSLIFTPSPRQYSFAEAAAVMPCLMNLKLGNRITSSDVDLPWSQLTSLTIHFPTAPQFFDVLGLCCNLYECILDDHDNSTVRWTPGVIHHPRLRKMTFRNCSLSAFLPLVEPPSLEELSISGILTLYRPNDAESVMGVGGTVERLRLETPIRPGPSYVELVGRVLGCMDGVRVLVLDISDTPGLAEEVVGILLTPRTTLGNGGNDEDILPRMGHLHLKARIIQDEEVIFRLIERRRNVVIEDGHCSQLELLHIDAPLSDETIERLGAEEGLQVIGLVSCQKHVNTEKGRGKLWNGFLPF